MAQKATCSRHMLHSSGPPLVCSAEDLMGIRAKFEHREYGSSYEGAWDLYIVRSS